jgi:hypothetical protein
LTLAFWFLNWGQTGEKLFYKESCSAIKVKVRSSFLGITAKEHEGNVNISGLPEHVLWMTEELSKWPTTSSKQNNFFVRFVNGILAPTGLQLYDVEVVRKATKAGRWIGWMFRATEELRLWTNRESHNCAKADVNKGFSSPH